jgi:hypothetical protein
MKRKVAVFLVLLAGLAGFATAQQGQANLTQTTLAGAVTGPSGYSGTTPTLQTYICLASVTGISTPILPGTPVSVIFVDREAMGVFNVSTSTSCVTVNRGYLGTQASPHLNGDMVLISNLYNTTAVTGGNPLPSGFYNVDPPQNGTCNAGVPTIPWVNVSTGAQWLCSTITGSWVPGWNNPLSYVSPVPTTAVASATTITPSGPFFHLTGTTPVTTITQPIGCNATGVGYCSFTIIADTGTSSMLATGGNLEIGAAITTLTGNQYTFLWDAKNSKWVVR